MDLQKVKQWIAEGNLHAVEEAWLEAVEDRASLPAMREVLLALVEAKQAETAITLAGLLLSEAAEHCEPTDALEIARTILPGMPDDPDLRRTAVELYREVYGEKEHFQDLLRASGLEE